MNELGKQVRDRAQELVLERYNVSKQEVREAFHPLIRAEPGDLRCLFQVFSSYSLPLSRFVVGVSRAGITYEIIRGQRKTIRDERFLARMRSGHVGVWYRMYGLEGSGWTAGRPETSSGNLPIEEEFRPGVVKMFGTRRIQQELKSIASEESLLHLIQKHISELTGQFPT
jgi:hypothetical protein